MARDRSRSRERRGDRDRGDRGRDDRERDDRDRGDRDRGDRDRGDRERGDRDRDDRGRRGEDDRGRRGDDEKNDRRSRERRSDRDAPPSSKDDRGRPEKAAAPEAEDPDDDEYRPGRQVMVQGLQKNPEKNGSIGQLVEFNKEKGRWVVAISSGNNNFKEENLELMADNSDILDENEEPPTAKIYITKLAAATTEKDLIDLFGGCGLIDKDPPKGSFKGHRDEWPYAVKLYKPGKENGDGCVTYMDNQSAKSAIKSFHRYKFKGTKIGVAYAGQGQTFAKVELQKPWHLREENQGKLVDEGGGGAGPGGGGKGPKPGDWECPGCGADVYASKDSCFKCGHAKPGKGGDGGKVSEGGGKRDGDGGKGGRPGDWTCPSCSASVFASKDTCFKCGESKPGGGGGGGKGKKGW